MKMKDRRIGVLLGGLSSEREGSLRTGEAVFAALLARGYRAIKIFVDRDLDLTLRAEAVETAYLALHGRYGEDGCVQGLLELLGIPYTGSGLLGTALAANKPKAKEVFQRHNLPTAASYKYVRGFGAISELRDQHGAFGFPVVVKPAAEGSSIAVRRVDDEEELEQAVEEALLFGDEVLVERYVEGQEIHVAVFEGEVLGMAEIAPNGPVFDYTMRRGTGAYRMFVPPRLSGARQHSVARLAQRAIHALGLSGLSEVDLIVSDRGNEVLLEVDALPSLAPDDIVPRIARACGIEFADLVEEALSDARLHTPRGRARAWQEDRLIRSPDTWTERRGAGIETH
jgi:D-alanine-D-alanine ligase